jgi:hypothetical protein
VARRVLLLAVIAVLGSATLCAVAATGSSSRAKASKGAVKLRTPGGKPLPGLWQPWANASLMPTVRGRVTVRRASCPARPSAAGCVYTRRPRTIWLKPGVDDPRGVLLHELGHVFDLEVLNNRDRGHFRRLMGRRSARWWRGSLPLAEQFAEAYSWCARYARIVSISRYSSYDYRPTARQHKAICRLAVRAARDRSPARKPDSVPTVTGPHPPPPAPPSEATGVVPGDPQRDPGPQKPPDPNRKPSPTPTPTPTATPRVPLPIPTASPTPTRTPTPLPTPPPLP